MNKPSFTHIHPFSEPSGPLRRPTKFDGYRLPSPRGLCGGQRSLPGTGFRALEASAEAGEVFRVQASEPLRRPAKFSGYRLPIPRGLCGGWRSFPGTGFRALEASAEADEVCRVQASEPLRRPAKFDGYRLPSPRKPSNNLFEPFRALGNLETTCLGLSEPSETFKQLVWAFPSPRKPSNNLFGLFRALGVAAAVSEVRWVLGKRGKRP